MMIFDQVKWVFLDMGSTLIDESDAYPVWFQRASAAVDGAISPEALARGYDEGMAAFKPTITGQLRPFGFTGESVVPLYPSELDKPYPQAQPLLQKLAQRYKLGVIANQSRGAAERLAQYGLLPYFAFVLGSDDVGLAKPDPRIFRLALDKANCAPQEAVMIGDRPDNDIGPAKQMGLRTIRVHQGSSHAQVPKSPEYEADATVRNLDEVAALLGVAPL